MFFTKHCNPITYEWIEWRVLKIICIQKEGIQLETVRFSFNMPMYRHIVSKLQLALIEAKFQLACGE